MLITFFLDWLDNWPVREAWAFAVKIHNEKRRRL